MKKMMIMLMATVAVCLCACSRPPLTECIVIGKDHTPAHTTTTLVMSGKVMVPITSFYPDTWEVTISGKDPDGDFVSRQVGVSEETYDSAKKSSKWADIP